MQLEKYANWGVWDTTPQKRASACLGILVSIFFLILIQFLQNKLV